MSEHPWWQRAVVYQIYPRSFAEGTGSSGVGDLRGIIDRIDYLAWLGVGALWVSPIFRSPMVDFGYDVSDYCDVDPRFGTLADVDELIERAHAHDIKVLLDWVPNHTSDQHPWFIESRADPTGAKANWYVWRDEPANNWKAAFPRGEDAWHFDEARNQWYLRCFAKEQPDLNWDEPAVQDAMLDTLRFWLDRGIDGFRMDVVHLIGKELERHDPEDAVARAWPHVTFNDVPATHERLRAIRALLDEYSGDRTSVGEVYLLDEEVVARYYGDNDELHLSFNFPFLWAKPQAADLRARIERTLEHLDPKGAWPTWVLSNHDVTRHRQRHGGDEAIARLMATVLLTLPGTPFMYQGEELGLVDAIVPPDRIVDLDGRDGCRAPIPWTAEPLHGWPADPWLPFPPEADTRNVSTEQADPASMLHLYRRLLQLRRSSEALQVGSFELLDVGEEVLGYERVGTDGRWTVLVNFSSSAVAVPAGFDVVEATTPDLIGEVDELPARTAAVGRRR
jgi:alpha-glucosidase